MKKKIGILIVVLLLGTGIGFVVWQNVQVGDVNKKITDALKETRNKSSYNFQINLTRYGEKEEYIGNICGEKDPNATHLLWQMGENIAEIYQINETYYRRHEEGRWLVISDLGYDEAWMAFQEMDPLRMLGEITHFEGEYLGREKLEKKAMQCYQVVSYDSLGKGWENLVYTLWIRDNLIYRCEMMITEKEEKDTLALELVLDYQEREAIVAPI